MSKPFIDRTLFLTTKEAAGILGVSLRTIQIWCESGILPSSKTPGGHRRIPNEAVQKCCEAMQVSGTTGMSFEHSLRHISNASAKLVQVHQALRDIQLKLVTTPEEGSKSYCPKSDIAELIAKIKE